MGFFDRLRGSAPPPPSPPPLPANAAMLANDLVLAAMIAPSGHPIDGIIGQASRGEVTPIVGDASLYWTLCAVRPTDTFQAARLAELLRYARIIPLTRDSAAPWTPPAPEEIEHWRNVVFGAAEADEAAPPQAPELYKIAPGELAAAPGMLCSSCYKVCSGADAHVIPWWNADAGDVFTTYRCGSCWLSSLDETDQFLQSDRFDADAQQKLAAFFGRHSIAAGTRLGALPRPEAVRVARELLAAVRSGAVVLQP